MQGQRKRPQMNYSSYLEIRFNRAIRFMGSMAFIMIILIYMAASLYGPAMALSQVTGISREISVLAIGLVCTFYTSIGGIRAVVWTDAFQILLIWAGVLTVMFKGVDDVGGWTRVWTIANQGSRLPTFDMNPDPFIRHTFWTLLIGGGINHMASYGANQANLQRYSSVRSLSESRKALMYCLPMWIFYLTIQCLLGLVMYAFFLNCDPLTSGTVSRGDQLLPLFVLKTVGVWRGLSGLFVSSIFSATISTVSSGVNSLAAVTLEDVVKPFYRRKSLDLSQQTAYRATVLLGILYGFLTIGLAYFVDVLGETAFMISFLTFSIVGSPILGLIVNGIFLPFVNSWGAGAGFVASLIVGLCVGIDPMIHPPPSSNLPLSTDGCLDYNATSVVNSDTLFSNFNTTPGYGALTTSGSIEQGGNSRLYLSYQHYSTVALLVSLAVGSLVSVITGCNKGRVVDPRTYLKFSWCPRTRVASNPCEANDDGQLRTNEMNLKPAEERGHDGSRVI